jgi:hypothetical protein
MLTAWAAGRPAAPGTDQGSRKRCDYGAFGAESAFTIGAAVTRQPSGKPLPDDPEFT